MKCVRQGLSLLFALLLCLCLNPVACALVEQSDSFYVADTANVLSDSTEQAIINYNGTLEQQCRGAQIVVVTAGYLDGMKSDEYAYQLFNDWGVGSAQYNNGMLLLLAVNENKAWLAYGLGLNAQLSGSEVDALLEEYFWPDFDLGRYDDAVNKLFTALLRFYDGLYGTSISGAASQSGAQRAGVSYGLARLIRALVILAILFALFGGNSRGNRGGSWLPWLLFFNAASRSRGYRGGGNWPPRGGGGFGGGGFGGGMGRGGGGFSGGGGGRR